MVNVGMDFRCVNVVDVVLSLGLFRHGYWIHGPWYGVKFCQGF